MNIYTVKITTRGVLSISVVRSNDKVTAINEAVNRLKDWRSKDGIENIEIIEDRGNVELNHTNY